MAINLRTIADFKQFFKSIESSHTFRSRQEYVDKFNLFKNVLEFPWREDQLRIIQSVVNDDYQIPRYQWYFWLWQNDNALWNADPDDCEQDLQAKGRDVYFIQRLYQKRNQTQAQTLRLPRQSSCFNL